MTNAPATRIWIAIALIVAGIAVPLGYGKWLGTRRFEPLKMPLPLQKGHVRSDDFYINVTGPYWVTLDVDYEFMYMHPECRVYGWDSVVHSRFTVSHGGEVIDEFEGARYLGGIFTARRSGNYRIDVEVLSDASCANAAHPRLVVFTDSSPYFELNQALRWCALGAMLGGLGLFSGVLLEKTRARFRLPQEIALSDTTSDDRHSTWPVRFRGERRAPSLPEFGLVCGVVVALVAMAMMVLQMNRPGSHGLPVWLAGRNQPGPEQLLPPVVVRIEKAARPRLTRVLVNSKPVEWSDLGKVLTEELKKRPDWIVYVEADQDLPFQDVVAAVDVIQSVHARGVLVISGTSDEKDIMATPAYRLGEPCPHY